CPHHPEKALPQYRLACNCRKPAPGMMLAAAKDLGIDLSQSVMFGDKKSDMQAALAAGIATRVLLGTDGKAEPEPCEEASLTAKDLLDGVTKLLAYK
ncbi:MAG: HAD hydrolase-like protein, partial [Sutterellaceae bacterium]|nr:HAD hydrolase-like protein [Sutterellaceae bacterium]